MNGIVDEFGRAMVKIDLWSATCGERIETTVWVDTAFNGELVIPRALVTAAGFEQSAGIRARLADGNEVTLEVYACELDWFGSRRAVEVIANDGEFPLLGIGLLIGHRLTIDYTDLTVTIE